MSAVPSGHVALVGLSGVGKSTLAPLLAVRMGCADQVDLDRVIEQRRGVSVQQFFDEQGEASFRAAETEALADALAGPPAVIATGGGVVLSATNRELLATGAFVVWLRASPRHLAERLAATTELRPLLGADPQTALERLAVEREALYSQLADMTLDVEGASPEQLVDEVLVALG